MSYDFLTDVVGIPAERLAVTVFEGYGNIPKDGEAYECWKRVGMKENQIYYYGMKENWWGPAGETGPCGPDTEIFYVMGGEFCGADCGPACSCGKYVEIWNNVFMQYNKLADGSFAMLDQKNVDTGMSLERILAIYNSVGSNYETDLFAPILDKLELLTGTAYSKETQRDFRIIADHVRAVTFILGDHKRIAPSNTGQGYILRRLTRRMIRLIKKLGVTENLLPLLAEVVIAINASVYPEVLENQAFIFEQLEQEYALFHQTLARGLKEAERNFSKLKRGDCLGGETAFRLFDTFGFPFELTEELAKDKGITVDAEEFRKHLAAHQEKSRSGARGMFKGGLAEHSEQTVKLHTATHLLNGALRKVLGDGVFQRGSHINTECLRFDFSFGRKLTEEELAQVNQIVNQAISERIDVVCEEMPMEEAVASGAVGVFDKKYGELVKVYSIEGYAKEICNGPHAGNTGELKSFTILKEESSSAGVRRIKAIIG